MNRKLSWTAALVPALIVGVVAFAQDSGKAKPQEYGKEKPMDMAPPKPSPELMKLGFFVGKWSGEETFSKTDFMPQGGKGQSTVEQTWDLNGLFLTLKMTSKSTMMTYESRAMTKYDEKAGCYRMYWFDNYGNMTEYTGKWEGEKLVYSGESEYQGMKIKEKIIYTKASPTQHKMVLEQDMGKGPYQFMEAVYTKQAGM